MVKMALPNGTKQSSLGTKKNELKVLGQVESQVGKTRYGSLLIRIGCDVIVARYSENTPISKSMIGRIENYSESWKNLPWKKFRRNLFCLQKRVFKAIRAGDKRKAMSLQKLILKSTAARLLAIRQVSQLNAGRKTAGIDGKKSLTFKERFELLELLKAKSNNWKHQKLRAIPILKKDGFTTRLLKIPTMADRAWQCLAKFVIEPAHEALFHERSYGFRPGVRFVG